MSKLTIKSITEIYSLVKSGVLSVSDALSIVRKTSPTSESDGTITVFSLLLSDILTLDTALDAISKTSPPPHTIITSPPIMSSSASSSNLSSVPSLVCMSLSSFAAGRTHKLETLEILEPSEPTKPTEPCPRIVYHYDGKTKRFEYWEVGGKLHRLNGPAQIEYDEDGLMIGEEWFTNNILHRLGGPARTLYNSNGYVVCEHWYENGVPPFGLIDGIVQKGYNPEKNCLSTQQTKTHLLGGGQRTSWFIIKDDGSAVLHSTRGPAVVEYDEGCNYPSKEIWYRDGVKHRPDNESAETEYYPNGDKKTQIFYKNGLFDTSRWLFNYLSFYEGDGGLKIKSGWYYDVDGKVPDGPHHISYYRSGIKKTEESFKNGKIINSIMSIITINIIRNVTWF